MDSDPWLRSAVKSCGRYTLTAQALHWITAALMVIVLPLAWVMVNMP
jgi:cytochrome b561